MVNVVTSWEYDMFEIFFWIPIKIRFPYFSVTILQNVIPVDIIFILT